MPWPECRCSTPIMLTIGSAYTTWYVTWLQRFQKAYESLEHEAALERKKLMAEHQRRIQDELARKKTDAMNNYLDALADDQPDVRYHAIGVARGCSGCTCTPPRAVKIFLGLIYRKNVKLHPSQSKSQFLGQFLLGVLNLEVYLDGLWEGDD